MPLIMGIGDEVVHFAAAVAVMAVAALAWWSTNARPDRYRAVILRPFQYLPNTHTVHTADTPMTLQYTNTESGLETSRTGELAVESRQSNATDRDVVPLQEMDSIVDAHMALLENNRLHFYRRVQSRRTVQIAADSATDTETDSQEDPEPASNAQIREMDSIVTAMEADETSSVFSRPNGNDLNSTAIIATCQNEKKDKDVPETNSNPSSTGGDNIPSGTDVPEAERKILIRLKYLNDTLREVDGSLDELLKDFKWRHFSNELSTFRVRLIFNGRVLGDEAATLRALGLHHRAVVHCLVHPRRAPHQRGASEEPAPIIAVEGGAGGPRAAPERAWDLENILMTLVSVALTIVWFFRCEYSNMFTASASVALFGLTVFYSVAIFGLYLSDTFHFDRRQPPPVPNDQPSLAAARPRHDAGLL